MTDELNLGTCCACGTEPATGLMMLNKRSPYGCGWGCCQCGLPMEGAIAVLCDACGESGELKWFCKGEVATGDRAPFAELVEPFEHNLDRHPELTAYADPVVLYDPETGPITDSQLTQIVEEVHQLSQQGALPPYWRNEQSGKLQPAIVALIEHGGAPHVYPPPTPEQVALVAQYLQLHINAPCWQEANGEISALRRSAAQIKTWQDCHDWLKAALEIGIDPL